MENGETPRSQNCCGAVGSQLLRAFVLFGAQGNAEKVNASIVQCGFLRKSVPQKCCTSHAKRKSLETGIGGSNLRKLEGGVKILNFRGSPSLALFYRDSTENPQLGGQKSKLSKDNFRGEFPPPSSVRYVLTPPIPQSENLQNQRKSAKNWEFGFVCPFWFALLFPLIQDTAGNRWDIPSFDPGSFREHSGPTFLCASSESWVLRCTTTPREIITTPLEIITWSIPGNTLCQKNISYDNISLYCGQPEHLAIVCCLLGKTNWERITSHVPTFGGVPEYFR